MVATAFKEEQKRADLSMLDYTYDLLTALSDEELAAVQAVAITFLKKNRYDDNALIRPFEPQKEDRLFTRIDRSLSEIKVGKYRPAEEVENELLEGLEE